MSDRIKIEGIEHGDMVHLTGSSWEDGGFDPNLAYEVDDVSFHRPVIYDNIVAERFEWYIMEKMKNFDFSVTKVEAGS